MATSIGLFDTYNRYLERVILPASQVVDDLLCEWEAPEYWQELDEIVNGPVGHRENESGEQWQPSPTIPSPVHDTRIRYKYIDSVIRKIAKNPEDFPKGLCKASLESMRDVLGARVIVYFPIQLAWVDRLIRSSDDFEIHETQTPKSYIEATTLERIGLDVGSFRVNQRKVSGYSSLHYVLRLRRRHRCPRPWFELQVRTIAEELWGEIEHQLGYKPNQDTEFSVRRQFRVISDHLHAIDMHLDFIYDQLQHFQRTRTLSDEDSLNAENLPQLLANYQLHVAQEDVGGATDILNGYGIYTVEDFQSHAQYPTLESIRSQWSIYHEGALPSALVTLHLLASLPSNCAREQVKQRVEGFSTFLRVTAVSDRRG